MGLHRLHPFIDVGHAHLRQAGRPYRPQAAAHGGAHAVRRGQGGVRPGHEHGDAHQRPPRLRPWGRRPHHLIPGDALRRGAAAQARHLHGRHRRRVRRVECAGPAYGRLVRPGDGLALDLLVHGARGPACRGGTRTHVAPRRPCPRKAPSRLARHDGHDRGRDLARAGHGLGRHAYSLGQSAVYGPCRSGCGCRCGLRAVGAPRRRAHHPHGALPQPQLRAVLGNGASPEHQLHGSAQLPAHLLPNPGRSVAGGGRSRVHGYQRGHPYHFHSHRLGRRRRGATRGCSWPCAS